MSLFIWYKLISLSPYVCMSLSLVVGKPTRDQESRLKKFNGHYARQDCIMKQKLYFPKLHSKI